MWFRREAVDAPACPYVEIVHNQHGRTVGIIEARNDDLIGNRCRRLQAGAAQAPAAKRCCGYLSPGLARSNQRIPYTRQSPAPVEHLVGATPIISQFCFEKVSCLAAANIPGKKLAEARRA